MDAHSTFSRFLSNKMRSASVKVAPVWRVLCAPSSLRPTKLRSLAAMWLFSAVLLFGQGVDLSHNHDGDLRSQFDCDICLVTGTLGHALTASALLIEPPQAFLHSQPAAEPVLGTLKLTRHARAPPLS